MNDQPVIFDEDTDTYSYTYEGTMDNQDMNLVFHFEVVTKQALVTAIEEAQALVGGDEYNTVIPPSASCSMKHWQALRLSVITNKQRRMRLMPL